MKAQSRFVKDNSEGFKKSSLILKGEGAIYHGYS